MPAPVWSKSVPATFRNSRFVAGFNRPRYHRARKVLGGHRTDRIARLSFMGPIPARFLGNADQDRFS